MYIYKIYLYLLLVKLFSHSKFIFTYILKNNFDYDSLTSQPLNLKESVHDVVGKNMSINSMFIWTT